MGRYLIVGRHFDPEMVFHWVYSPDRNYYKRTINHMREQNWVTLIIKAMGMLNLSPVISQFFETFRRYFCAYKAWAFPWLKYTVVVQTGYRSFSFDFVQKTLSNFCYWFAKGHLISKCLFGVFVLTKKSIFFFMDFCPSL